MNCKVLVLLCAVSMLISETFADDPLNFFANATKIIPRIGRRSKNKSQNDDFQNFFLKVSKSIPRIGRRNQETGYNEEPFYRYLTKESDQQLGEQKPNYPTWSDLADKFEYEPHLFTSAEMLAKLGEMLGEESSDWEKIRMKRATKARQY